MAQQIPLNERTSATPAGGIVTLQFEPCTTGRVWQGTLTIPGALGTDDWTVTINDQLFATLQGPGPFGPIQLTTGGVLKLIGTVGGTGTYLALLSGLNDPAGNATPYTGPLALPSPAAPSTVIVSGSVDVVVNPGAGGAGAYSTQVTKTAHAGAPINVVSITGPNGIVVTDVSMWLDDPAAFTGSGFALCQSSSGNEYFGAIPAGGNGASEWHSARGLFVPTGHGPNIEVVVSGTYPSNVGVSVTYDQL